jgi:ornithine decarboxylase
MNSYFKLTQAAVEDLGKQYDTPLLLVSTEEVERNYSFLANYLPGVKLHYAVKANPNEIIIRKLAELGSYFDVASDGEMQFLADMGIPAERMVYANPVKTASGLKVAKQIGVYKFTFDSESEISKMAKAIPGGTVLLRVRVDNPNALVDLNKKFGAHPEEVLPLLTLARQQGLDVAGLCFHVGSQSSSADAYLESLKIFRDLFEQAKKAGFDLRVLDIGGGFPIPAIENNTIDIVGMLQSINEAVTSYFPDTEIWAEPGRFICGTVANLITRVIGTQKRNSKIWYFLDDGLYGTFSGVIFDHWDFELETFKSGEKIPATFAGPSCDSLDIMFQDKLIPTLDMDDLILVPACGAYTSASATVFNGFAKTRILEWEKVRDTLNSSK